MALADYVYRLKAEAGDSSPHDELGVSGDMSGATFSLVDLGAGEYEWQVSGGQASVSIPGKTVAVTTAGGGITVAIRLRVVNYGTVDYTMFGGVGPAVLSTLTSSNGLHMGRVAANQCRARHLATITSGTWTPGVTEQTVIMCLRCNVSGGTDYLDTYNISAQPNRPAGQTAIEFAAAVAVINASNSAVLGVKDFVVWNEELSDADCVALADDLRGTLDGSGATDATTTGGTGTSTGSGSGGDATGSSGGTDATTTGGTGTSTGSGSGGSATGAASATITLQAIDYTTKELRVSETGVEAIINELTGELVLRQTGLSIDASGNCPVTNVAFTSGTEYRCTTIHSDGSEGFWRYTAV